ncbi:hypothetical protein DFP72DRAFT_90644 [Ephemerocybe angulata]|uniref:MYND-type domain-containing protein n=1 Tax=Ephemerocybe angulata TaxID=980116 RepID=A0A8H6LWR5_9AGAR|nr:hypothetical protein DFP72DRAFT_90644 [Tulosesus angulatus]
MVILAISILLANVDNKPHVPFSFSRFPGVTPSGATTDTQTNTTVVPQRHGQPPLPAPQSPPFVSHSRPKVTMPRTGETSMSAVQRRKIESYLTSAEAGSREHIDKLSNDWPTDKSHSLRLASIALRHISSTPPPPQRENAEQSLHFTFEEVRAVGLMHSCVPCAENALRSLVGEDAEHTRAMFDIFREHIHPLLDWLVCFVQNWDLVRWDVANPRFHGTVAVCVMILGLLDTSSEPYFSDDPRALGRMVDIVLSVWMAGVNDDGANSSPREWRTSVSPIVEVFRVCVCKRFSGAQDILLERVGGFRTLQPLADACTRRLAEWETVHRGQYTRIPQSTNISGLQAILQAVQGLTTRIEGFSRVLFNTRFYAIAIGIAGHFKGVLTGQTTVAVYLVKDLFPPKEPRGFDWCHIVPELLASGLLNIILDDLVTRRAGRGEAQPFSTVWKEDPLDWLQRMAHYPRIGAALVDAVGAVPNETRRAISSHPIAKKVYTEFARVYISTQVVHKSLSGDTSPILYCDSLKHQDRESSGLVRAPEESRECSWCRVTIYCSIECQKEDWHRIHRKECRQKRVYRIDRQLQDVWISQRSRRFYLARLENRIQAAMTCDPDYVRNLPPSANVCSFTLVDYREKPPMLAACVEPSIDYARMTAGVARLALFNDEREKEVLIDWEENKNVHLAASISPFVGRYVVLVLGRFLRVPDPSGSDSYKYKVINGFLRIAEVDS